MDESKTKIERVHQFKLAIERNNVAEKQSGRIACPECLYDGRWVSEAGGWCFLCDECGVQIDGRFSRARSAN